MSGRRLIDAHQAAEMLGVQVSWIRTETRHNRIPHIPLGRYRKYDPVELEAWWKSRARGPRARDVAPATAAELVAAAEKLATAIHELQHQNGAIA